MKKRIFFGLIAVFLFNSGFSSFAQRETLADLLEKTILLSESGKITEFTEALKSTTFVLESEAYTRGNEMKDKLLGQATTMRSLFDSASDGTLKVDVLSKVINTVRLLVGANQINNLLSEGKEGLLGNAEYLTYSVNLLQSGKIVLDSKRQEKLTDLLESASIEVKNLNRKDATARATAASAKKIFRKIVDLVNEAI